jgi:hypothetical protein
MPWHVSPLLRQYATYKNMACTAATNFASGLQAENAAMIFVLPPAQGVISPLELEPGIYSRTAQDGGFNDVYARYILEYFGKQTLMVVHNRPCETPATAQPVP